MARNCASYWIHSTPEEYRARPEIIGARVHPYPDAVHTEFIFHNDPLRPRQNAPQTQTQRSSINDYEDPELTLIRRRIKESRSIFQNTLSSTIGPKSINADPVSLISSEDENEPELDAESEERLFDSFENTEPSSMTANEDNDHFMSHMYAKYIPSRSGFETSSSHSPVQPLTSSSLPQFPTDEMASFDSLDQHPLLKLVQSAPTPPLKKQSSSKPVPSNSKFSVPAAPKQKKTRLETSVPVGDPEINRINHELISIINEIYGDETAGHTI